MIGLVPFVIICALLAVAILAVFAVWQRRDSRAGSPWSAETAAKIYVSTIATFLVGALGLAATPLVGLDALRATQADPASAATASESGTIRPSGGAGSSATPSTAPSTAVVDDARAGEITLIEGHGVDLDTTDRTLLPTNDTPGLDIALDTNSTLHTPDGQAFERATAEPTLDTCASATLTEYYNDYSEDQWFCAATSEGTTASLHITQVAEKSSGMEVVAAYVLADAAHPPPHDDGTAEITDEVVLTEANGVDVDTADPVLLPTNDTPDLDIALDTNGTLYTPDGTSFVRATTQPTADRCEPLTDTNYYNDYAEHQWFCFATSEGTVGYLQVTSVTEKSTGAEVGVTYYVFGAPSAARGSRGAGHDGPVDALTVTEAHGVDLDARDPVLLPTSDTPDLDIALDTNGTLYTPDGTSFVRATTQPTADRCEPLTDTNYYNDYAENQWFCFTTSGGQDGYLRVRTITDRSEGVELTFQYARFE